MQTIQVEQDVSWILCPNASDFGISGPKVTIAAGRNLDFTAADPAAVPSHHFHG